MRVAIMTTHKANRNGSFQYTQKRVKKMLTSTSLQHKKVKLNIIRAMHKSMNQNVAHVRNKKGEAFIAVRYDHTNDSFEFTNRAGKNLANMIGTAYIIKSYDEKIASVFYPEYKPCRLKRTYHIF